ncbi:hypothetical protein [Anaeromyxobacter diazotrophicus]|uniref:Uncharacterized protein n=1 Tax=Anaeromyxobacter diazotrophicus TaxID=2590199 RepID=A0A7I9VGE6_9BACT|nr:hypothetical protein [Anaeromyxobacter diazotrophicus]GEJ55463.1 hypothetical protein AMYX_02040 [Anaeromyxobacter diazotrophicus]
MVARREAGYEDRACRDAVRAMVRAYREHLAVFAELRWLPYVAGGAKVRSGALPA